VAVFSDISAIKEAEQRLHYLPYPHYPWRGTLSVGLDAACAQFLT
jgi:hypothetical protein